MEDRFEVTWMPAAKRNLREIREYLTRREPSAVDLVLDTISDLVATLPEWPHRGEIFRRLNGVVIRETLAGNYRVFFRVDEDERLIEILRVWHTSRDEPDLFNFE